MRNKFPSTADMRDNFRRLRTCAQVSSFFCFCANQGAGLTTLLSTKSHPKRTYFSHFYFITNRIKKNGYISNIIKNLKYKSNPSNWRISQCGEMKRYRSEKHVRVHTKAEVWCPAGYYFFPRSKHRWKISLYLWRCICLMQVHSRNGGGARAHVSSAGWLINI